LVSGSLQNLRYSFGEPFVEASLIPTIKIMREMAGESKIDDMIRPDQRDHSLCNSNQSEGLPK